MIRGLTVRQPWAWAIAHGGKRIENRTWRPSYRGWVAVHAATAHDRGGADLTAHVAGLAGVPVTDVERGAAVRAAFVAVALLADVCSESAGLAKGCGCGPWAVPGQHHFQLTEVLALPEPVPCKGHLGLWFIPGEVASTLREQWMAAQPSQLPK